MSIAGYHEVPPIVTPLARSPPSHLPHPPRVVRSQSRQRSPQDPPTTTSPPSPQPLHRSCTMMETSTKGSGTMLERCAPRRHPRSAPSLSNPLPILLHPNKLRAQADAAARGLWRPHLRRWIPLLWPVRRGAVQGAGGLDLPRCGGPPTQPLHCTATDCRRRRQLQVRGRVCGWEVPRARRVPAGAPPSLAPPPAPLDPTRGRRTR